MTTDVSEPLTLLKSVLDTNLVAISVLRAVRNDNGDIIDFRIEIVNRELERQTGRSDLEGKLYAQVYPGIKENGLFETIVQVLRTGKPTQLEYHYNADGFDNWFQSMFVQTHDGIVATNLDITERKNVELKAKELELKKNKDIYEASVLAQEEERKRIAESLHNGLGQLLYAAKLSVESVKPGAKVSDEQIAESRSLTLKMLTQAIKEARRISHILSPTILQDFGLKAAIQDTCEQFRSIIDIDLTYLGVGKLNHPIELTLYRSVQELLHNIAKHSKATKCSVLLHVKQNEVLLSIKDNGVGFDKKIESKGIGLHSLRNQIDLLQGKFYVQSAIGEGTTTLIHIPLESAPTIHTNHKKRL